MQLLLTKSITVKKTRHVNKNNPINNVCGKSAALCSLRSFSLSLLFHVHGWL